MISIVPATIPQSKEQLEEEIKRVASFAPLVQVDICDGVFVKNKTWPYNGRDQDFFAELKAEHVGWPEWEKTDIEVHLMVKNPEETIGDWLGSGISSLVVHVEATDKFEDIIALCRNYSVSIGLAIKPRSELRTIEALVPHVDFIQCMGSDTLGQHGVPLEPRVLPRIVELRKLYPERIIAVDIGVTEETLPELVAAGASKFIVGGTILEASNPKKVYDELLSLS